MARTKSANPKPTKRSKTSAAQSEENLTVTNGAAAEEAVQKKASQSADTLSQTPAMRTASQQAQNRAASQNGASNITEEHIRERAYQLYLERGRQHGRHEDDWYRAESELRGYKR